MSLLSANPVQIKIDEAPPITCRVVDSFMELEAIRQEWDALVLSAGSDLYMSYDWCRCWWDVYGQGRQLRVFLFYRGSTLCGIVPCFTQRLWLGIVWVKLAKLVGSDSTIAMSNPPIKQADAKEVYSLLCHTLLKEQHCDAILFAPIASDYPALSALRNALSASPEHFHLLQEKVLSPYSVMHLPSTMDDYLKMMSKNQRSNYKRTNNLLSRSFPTHLDFVTDPNEIDSEFTRFIAMHNAQWHCEKKLGHFGDWPDSEKFNRALVHAHVSKNAFRLIRLTADDQPIAYQYCLQFGDTWYWRLPARISGSEWERFGIGRLGFIKMMELAIANGIRHIELGAGHYDYKLDLGGQESSLLSLFVVRKNWAAQLRSKLFLQLSKFLHLTYYRIWFLRLAPRLPLPRRHLNKTWIQTRI